MKFSFTLILFLLLLLISSSAFGHHDPTITSGSASTSVSEDADPARMTLEQMLEFCRAKWGDRASAVAQCVTNLRLAANETRGEQTLSRVDVLEQKSGAILESVDELGRKFDRFTAAQSRPIAINPAQTTASGNPPVPQATNLATRTGGAAWTPVHQPTVMSIYSLKGMAHDILHIMGLDHPTARRTCGGVGAPLVVFLDHGVPITNVIAPEGAPTNGFVEVYWDRQNDGVPDGTVKALDLSSQTDVWITWGLGSKLKILYLRPGTQGVVEGLPLQTLYHPTVRAEASASGVIGCDDDDTPRGGYRPDQAYSMSRMW